MRALKATILDDDAVRILAFPFSGPIPSPTWPGGVDLDGETFTARTDIKADWFDSRPVDWHHGKDGLMRRSVIGKATGLHMEEDGWWVDVWLAQGAKQLGLIKRLAERGGQLFGSSEPIQDLVKINKANGHIDVWPFLRETLSTSPVNTHSIIEPLRADLSDVLAEGYHPSDAFWTEVLDGLHDLGLDLPHGAKAGQVDSRELSQALSSADATVARLTTLLSQRAR